MNNPMKKDVCGICYTVAMITFFVMLLTSVLPNDAAAHYEPAYGIDAFLTIIFVSCLFFYFNNVDRCFQKQIDKFIAGTIGGYGQLIEFFYQFVLHTNGYDLIAVIPLFRDFLGYFDLFFHFSASLAPFFTIIPWQKAK